MKTRCKPSYLSSSNPQSSTPYIRLLYRTFLVFIFCRPILKNNSTPTTFMKSCPSCHFSPFKTPTTLTSLSFVLCVPDQTARSLGLM